MKYLKFSRSSLAGAALIISGSLSWSLLMVKSGLKYNFGIGFWGPNGHDGVWHIAIINSLVKGSWQMPIFAGELLKNYHIGFDLLIAIIHKITFIPVPFLYFQIMPPIIALSIGLLTYHLVFQTSKSKIQSCLSVFCIYFSGGFGYIVAFLKNASFDGESVFWSQQAISTLINPPYALSLVFILIGLILLQNARNKVFSKKHFIILTVIFGTLFQIKVYAGLLCLFALFVLATVNILKRRDYKIYKVFVGALMIFVLIYLGSNIDSSAMEFKPFWYLETMMSFSDRVGWVRFADAMINYRYGGNIIKALVFYSSAFVIFVVGNIGTRMIAFLNLKSVKKFTDLEIFSWSLIVPGILIPTFFVQKGTAWNTIQFMYYSMFFLAVLAGMTLGKIADNIIVREKDKKKKIVFLLTLSFLGILTLPTTISTLKNHYLPSRPPAKISNEELEALRFLSDLNDGVVLTVPFDKEIADSRLGSPPRDLAFYESTAYVSAYSNKTTFFEDEVNLEITGYDWRGRRQKVLHAVEGEESENLKRFLEENKITYLYWIKDFQIKVAQRPYLQLLFENSKVSLFQII